MAALDTIASELLKSANEADLNYKKTRDQTQLDKAVRLRRIVENLLNLTLGASDLNGLSDVTLTGVTNGQVLLYDGATEQWINGSAGGGGDMLKAVYDPDDDGVVDASETVQIIVRNSTGSTLSKGSVVYLSGATGNRPNAVLAQANSEMTSSKTIGIVIANIANNADGYVAVSGTLHDLDTSAFTAGDAVWLSPTVAGGITTTVPSEPNHSVFVGYIARSHPTQGRLVIAIQNGYELNELHNVVVPSPSNGDLLQYDSANLYWKNVPVATAVPTPTLAQVTTAGNTTTNAITVGGLTTSGQVLFNAFGAYNTGTPTLRIENVDTNNVAIQIKGNVANYKYYWIYDSQTTEGIYKSDQARIDFYGGTNVGFAFRNNYGRLFTIVGTTGNVLINTTTDAGYKLDVNGTARVQGAVVFSNSSISNLISLQSSTSTSFIWQGNNTSAGYQQNNLNIQPYTGSLGVHISNQDGTTILYAKSSTTDSAVGIGTMSPTYKLQVIGSTYNTFSTTAPYLVDTSANNYRIGNLINNSGYNSGGFANNTFDIFSVGANSSSSANADKFFRININGGSSSGAYGASGNNVTLAQLNAVTNSILYITAQGSGGYIQGSTSSGLTVSTLTYGENLSLRSDMGSGFGGGGINYYASINGANHSHRWFTTLTEHMRLTSGGNLLIGTTTDAGYKLDVNGTARVGNDFTIDNNRYLKAYRWTNADTSFPLQLESNSTHTVTGINFISYNNNLLNNTKSLFTFGLVSPITTQSSGSVDVANVINIVPEINFAFGTHTVRGIYYNPTLTSLTGTTHRAIETTSGDVILNTQSASVNAGYTTVAVGGSSGVYFQMYVGPNPTAQYLRGQLWAVGNNLLLNNPSLGYLGLYTTLYSGITVWPTTGNVYVGASPSTDAGYKLDVNGNARVSGDLSAVNGLITFSNPGGNRTMTTSGLTINYGSTYSFSVIGTNTASITPTADLTLKGIYHTQVSTDVYRIQKLTNVGHLQINFDIVGSDATAYNYGTRSGNVRIYPGAETNGNGYGNVILGHDGTNSRGNVGIGTSTPTDKLHIVDNTNGNKFARISAGGTDASAAWVAQNNQVDNIVYRVFGSAVTGSQMGQALARSASLIANLGGTGKFLIGSYSGTDLIFGTSDQARMRLVDATGNFLIGTMTDNGNKLTVSGNIDAQGYKVNNVLGYTGILNIPTNPPGQQNIDIQGGIVINIF